MMTTNGVLFEVTRRTSAEQLINEIYAEPSTDSINQFFLHNAHINPQSLLKPGSLIYQPSADGLTCIDPRHVHKGINELNEIYSRLTPAQHEIQQQLRPLLETLDNYNEGTSNKESGHWKASQAVEGNITGYGGAGVESIKRYIELTKEELGSYQQLYSNTLRQYGTLHHPEFYMQRQAISWRLNILTKSFLHELMFPDSNANSPFHKQLGLSTKRAERSWRLKGEAGLDFKRLAEKEMRLAGFSEALERGNKIFLRLDIGMAVGETITTYTSGKGLVATGKVAVVDAAKISAGIITAGWGATAGELAGAYIGGWIGGIMGEIAFPAGGGIIGATAGRYIGGILGTGIGSYEASAVASDYAANRTSNAYDVISQSLITLSKEKE